MANSYPGAPPGIGIGRSPPGEAPPPPPAGLGGGGGANPPGLWQPPGFGGLGGPPFAAAGSASAATSHGAVGEGRELELQKEITGTIEAQVQRLIEQARHDTESKVKMELKSIRESMMAIDGGLDNLLAQLDSIEPQTPVEPPMDAEAVGKLLSKIEQQWGQEIRTLKQELHQTILAHNHNADLIKHHKETIDALREKCLKQSTTKTSEVGDKLQKLDARLKQQQKQRKLEPLFERLQALEQRVAAAHQQGASAWARYSAGVPPMVPPGMPVPPGIPPGMMPGLNSAATANLMASLKGAKGAGLGGAAMAGAGAGSGAAAKTEAKAAFKNPTDEEVQARLSKLSVGAEASPAAAGGAFDTAVDATAEASAAAESDAA